MVFICIWRWGGSPVKSMLKENNRTNRMVDKHEWNKDKWNICFPCIMWMSMTCTYRCNSVHVYWEVKFPVAFSWVSSKASVIDCKSNLQTKLQTKIRVENYWELHVDSKVSPKTAHLELRSSWAHPMLLSAPEPTHGNPSLVVQPGYKKGSAICIVYHFSGISVEINNIPLLLPFLDSRLWAICLHCYKLNGWNNMERVPGSARSVSSRET